MLEVQMLGHAEAPLSAFEATTAELIKSQDQAEHGALLTTQCFALSNLWVIGFYELLRKLRDIRNSDFDAVAGLFDSVSILRMPLAKHQVLSAPNYRNKFHYPTSIFNPTTGRIGWRVFDPKLESYVELFRGDLADQFLSLSSKSAPLAGA
jgi:hypothetical protein